MGAWGDGSFENDAALDFVDDIKVIDDLMQAFTAVGQADAFCDADKASEAVAAADLVAAMMGRPGPDLPEHLAAMVSELGTASERLIAAAVDAVQHVREHSELAELWAEAEDEGWKGAIEDLLTRLDPATPYAPPPPRGEVTQGEIFGNCLLCDGSIPEADMVTVTIEDEGIVSSSLTLYAHRECLEKKFKPPYYTDDGLPHPDLLVQVKGHLDSLI